MREIVGQFELRALVNCHNELAAKVQKIVINDLDRIGLVAINFTVLNFTNAIEQVWKLKSAKEF